MLSGRLSCSGIVPSDIFDHPIVLKGQLAFSDAINKSHLVNKSSLLFLIHYDRTENYEKGLTI